MLMGSRPSSPLGGDGQRVGRQGVMVAWPWWPRWGWLQTEQTKRAAGLMDGVRWRAEVGGPVHSTTAD